MLLTSCSICCCRFLVSSTFVFIYISLHGCLLLAYACIDILNSYTCRCSCLCWTCSLYSSNLLDCLKKKIIINYVALFCVIVVYALHIRLYLVLNYSLILCKLPASLVSMNMSIVTSAGTQNCIASVLHCLPGCVVSRVDRIWTFFSDRHGPLTKVAYMSN